VTPSVPQTGSSVLVGLHEKATSNNPNTNTRVKRNFMLTSDTEKVLQKSFTAIKLNYRYYKRILFEQDVLAKECKLRLNNNHRIGFIL